MAIHMKCLLCKTGNVTESGCFMFCDGCNFTSFKVTNEYMEASGALLGALCSNIRFNNEEAFMNFIVEQTTTHLPHLEGWINSTAKHTYKEVFEQLRDSARANSINLQIGDEEHNPSSDLKCACGSTRFTSDASSPFKARCLDCHAIYRSSEEANKFIPYFHCDNCGSIHFNVEEAGMVSCANEKCLKLFMYVKVSDKFHPIST